MEKQSLVPYTIEQEYLSIKKFVEEHKSLTYLQFDNYITENVNLFALPEHERFMAIDHFLDKIIAALPAFKRIFSKPITRLKDVNNLLSVEAVRIINNETIRHISIHTELWGNITKEGLMPRKLLTLSREEEYETYENIAFARLVTTLLSFTRKNIRSLKDIIYSCQTMQFNLLERTNHLMYFLAIGKLHVGYAHTQDKYHYIHQRCLEKLLFIENALGAKLKSPVYRICRKNRSKLTLKKTNVFRLQKDYKLVYSFLKLLNENSDTLNKQMMEEALSVEGYADYCTLLSIFAAGHFNYKFNEKTKIVFRKLNVKCNYKTWNLNIQRVYDENIGGLIYSVNKDKTYSICLIFYQSEKISKENLANFKNKFKADEYLFTEPSEFNEKGRVYLNLFDMDSFRRLQQLILRCMIYADETYDICPFCGAILKKVDNNYECEMCKTVISKHTCTLTGKEFFATSMKGYKKHFKEQNDSKLFKEKDKESILFYRNITPLTLGRKICCPHCGKIQK